MSTDVSSSNCLAPQRHASPSAHAGHAPSRTQQGLLAFVAGSVLLGSVGVFVHQAGADPWTATWFRCAFGWLGLSLWLAATGQWRQLRLARADVLWVLASGALLVLAWGLFFAAMAHVPAGVATLLFHVQPLWLLLLGPLVLREAVDRHSWLAVALAMLGLLLATGLAQVGQGAHAGSGAGPGGLVWLGVALCLFGSLCTAGVSLSARKLQGLSAAALAWWHCAMGTVALLVWPLTQGWPAWGSSWAWLAGLGLIHTALAYGLMYAGMARLPASRIARLQFIYPAVALALDWAVYGQRLGGVQLAGVALMAWAIWWAERRG